MNVKKFKISEVKFLKINNLGGSNELWGWGKISKFDKRPLPPVY